MLGQGATFTIYLPRGQSPDSAEAASIGADLQLSSR